jgi:choline-sulfatase
MSEKPNILLIMTDQQRWDALGCVGGWVKTPNLDRLAAEGVRFANCVTTAPACVPARTSLASGWYPHNTHIWNNCQHTFSPEQPTWMRAIRDAGYRTAVIGKTHLHPHQGDLREREHLLHAYGMDDVDEIGGPRASARVMSHMTEEWERDGLLEVYREDFRQRGAGEKHPASPSELPLESYADVYVGRKARAYLEAYDRPEPWFCWVSFGGPHEPWDAPEPYASMYNPDDMPSPAPDPESTQDRPTGVLDERPRRPSDPKLFAELRANYAGNVTLIDEQIGKILDTVEARGEWERTVVAFVSDHGELNGDAGLVHKHAFLDGAVRVPMIVRTPETARAGGGRVNESMVEWIDLGPTLAEAAGGVIDYPQFGRSLGPVLRGETHAHRPDALSELLGECMLADPDWKIALNREGQAYLLFDRRNDPGETRNLAGRPEWRERETDMRLRLLRRLIEGQVRLDEKPAKP